MITLPAGTYYIGDPCYVFERPSWEKLGDQTDWFNKFAVAELKGRKLVAFGTAYGDGTYVDLDDNRYPVDAGLIGAVPIELIEKGTIRGQNIFYDYEGAKSHGKIVTFSRDFRCYTASSGGGAPNGELHFGTIVIDTDPRDEDDE